MELNSSRSPLRANWRCDFWRCSRIVRVLWLVNVVKVTKPKQPHNLMGIIGGAGRARIDDPRIMRGQASRGRIRVKHLVLAPAH